MTDRRVRQGLIAPKTSQNGGFTTDALSNGPVDLTISEVDAPKTATEGYTFTIEGTVDVDISDFSAVETYKGRVVAQSPAEDGGVIHQMDAMERGESRFFDISLKSGTRAPVTYDVELEAQWKPLVGDWQTVDTETVTITIEPVSDGGDDGGNDSSNDGSNNDGNEDDTDNENNEDDDSENKGLWSSLSSDQKILVAGGGALALLAFSGNSGSD